MFSAANDCVPMRKLLLAEFPGRFVEKVNERVEVPCVMVMVCPAMNCWPPTVVESSMNCTAPPAPE